MRKIISGKTAVIVFAVALVLCLLTSCGKETAPSSAEAAAQSSTADLKKVTVLLDWTPNTNHTGIYAARDLGFYEEAGLQVDIQIPYDGTATQLVGVGKGEFGISNTEDTLHAVSLDDPMPVISIAAIIQHNTSGFVSLKEKGIRSPADWSGKTYGGFGGTTEQKIVQTIAADNGVDPDSIRFVDLGNSDTLTALQNEIDFIWVFEAAELTALDKEGVEYNYLPVRDYGEAFDYYTPIIVANTDAAAADPDMVKAFTAATAKGYEYAIEHPDEAAELLLKAEDGLDEYIVTEGQRYLSERYAEDAPRWGWQEEAVWQRFADFLEENDLIENEADVNRAFTTEYLPEE
ncbi:MAG: ABC transporter substrate-binding protein [Lachnospiraceae bacterium]|nr:ABC transporter substrate-binding protein [Lachnospiraceae bacterium]